MGEARPYSGQLPHGCARVGLSRARHHAYNGGLLDSNIKTIFGLCTSVSTASEFLDGFAVADVRSLARAGQDTKETKERMTPIETSTAPDRVLNKGKHIMSGCFPVAKV